MLGRRTLAAYLGAIVAGAVGFGLAIDYLLPAAWFFPSGAVHAACHGKAGYSWVEVASSALLAALLAYALMKRFIHRKNDTSMTKQIYRVGGMSCNHCKASVEKNLALLPSVTAVEVDLTAGTVAVEGTAEGARIIASSDRMKGVLRQLPQDTFVLDAVFYSVPAVRFATAESVSRRSQAMIYSSGVRFTVRNPSRR